MPLWFAIGAPMKGFGETIFSRRILITACTVLTPFLPLPAQKLTAIGGRVTDSAGAPISGATLALSGTSLRAVTDEIGEFRIGSVTAGVITVTVRRLGFAPIARELRATAGQPLTGLHFKLDLLPATLSPVLVNSSRVEYSGRLAGYYQRLRRRSSGYFISRDEIDAKSFRSLSQLLKSVPGINSFALRSGGSTVRMRQRDCRPLVWLDGVPMPAGEVDLDAFPVSTIHGIELYSGSTTAPSDFTANGGLSSCGTILLWSRGPDTEAPRVRRAAKVDVQKLVESLSVFTASEVDTAAQPVAGTTFDVRYPPDLLAARVSGAVVAEFVVDGAGGVEMETFSIITSSDPRFSASVLKGMEHARFTPAIRNGRAVRQVLQLPFSFTPGIPDVVKASR